MVELAALCAGAVQAGWFSYFFAAVAIADYIASFTAWSQIEDQVEDKCTYDDWRHDGIHRAHLDGFDDDYHDCISGFKRDLKAASEAMLAFAIIALAIDVIAGGVLYATKNKDVTHFKKFFGLAIDLCNFGIELFLLIFYTHTTWDDDYNQFDQTALWISFLFSILGIVLSALYICGYCGKGKEDSGTAGQALEMIEVVVG